MITVNTTDGIITGRNGTYNLKQVQLFRMGGLIRIDGVSSKRGVVVNAGLSTNGEAFKELIIKYKEEYEDETLYVYQ